jgi:DNA-binding transcriptional regulator YdaS (Cro superfamily)
VKLTEYLQSAGRGEAARIARELGVRPVVVSRWQSGAKPIPTDRCAMLERVTGNRVMRWDLRPQDWQSIWPELVGADGAPCAEREVSSDAA